jgi:acyl carrier protein
MAPDTLERVRRCVAEVLALDPREVTAASRLITDLGAESLDLVELMYLLENEFEIRLSRGDVSISAQLGLPEDEIHVDEVLTPRALELLLARFPGDTDLLREGATLRSLAALLTVGEVVRVVDAKLAGPC